MDPNSLNAKRQTINNKFKAIPEKSIEQSVEEESNHDESIADLEEDETFKMYQKRLDDIMKKDTLLSNNMDFGFEGDEE